jgi:hypothetical protein
MRSDGEIDVVIAAMLARVDDPSRAGCWIGSPKSPWVAIVTGDEFIVVHAITSSLGVSAT